MAKCPKCGVKLHIWNVKAECPNCGVNIANYDWENRLEEDSIRAEAAFARINENIRKFKFSFVGSKLRKARIPLSVLPLFSFLLPLASVATSLPFYDSTVNLSAITLVINIINNADVINIAKLVGSPIVGSIFSKGVIAVILMILSALSLVVSLVFLLLNFRKLNSKGLFVTNLLASLMMTASAILTKVFSGELQTSSISSAVSANPSWGIVVSAALFLVSAVINLAVSLEHVEIPFDKEKEDTAQETESADSM